MKQEELELGMVFSFTNNSEIEYVIIDLSSDKVSLERINYRDSTSDRHTCGYGWFDNGSSIFIRKMDEKEFRKYQVNDPICNLERGIYRLRRDIIDMDSRLKANDGEVIDVLQIDCEKSLYGNFYIEISFRRFGIADDTTVTFYEDTKKACIDLFNRIMRKININM